MNLTNFLPNTETISSTEVLDLSKSIFEELFNKINNIYYKNFNSNIVVKFLRDGKNNFIKGVCNDEDIFSIILARVSSECVIITLKTLYDMPYSVVYDKNKSYEDNLGLIYSKLLLFFYQCGIKIK